jgi:hypothetical protein
MTYILSRVVEIVEMNTSSSGSKNAEPTGPTAKSARRVYPTEDPVSDDHITDTTLFTKQAAVGTTQKHRQRSGKGKMKRKITRRIPCVGSLPETGHVPFTDLNGLTAQDKRYCVGATGRTP